DVDPKAVSAADAGRRRSSADAGAVQGRPVSADGYLGICAADRLRQPGQPDAGAFGDAAYADRGAHGAGSAAAPAGGARPGGVLAAGADGRSNRTAGGVGRSETDPASRVS